MTTVRGTVRYASALLVCALVLLQLIGASPVVFAESDLTVTSDEELLAALNNSEVAKITIDYSSPTLTADALIDRPLVIAGDGGTLVCEGSLIVAPAGELTVYDISFSSDTVYPVSSSGKLSFHTPSSFRGPKGIMLSGGSMTTTGHTLSFDSGTACGIDIAASDKSVSLNDIYIWHNGRKPAVQVSGAKSLLLSGSVTLISDGGPALIAESSCDVLLSPDGQIKIKAENSPSYAVNLSGGFFSLGSGAVVSVSGGAGCLRCGSFISKNNCDMTFDCLSDGGEAVIYCGESMDLGQSGVLSVSAVGSSSADGILSKGKTSFGDGCRTTVSGGGGSSGISASGSVICGSGSSLTVRGFGSGISSSGSFSTGTGCTVDLVDITSCCVRASSVTFGKDTSAELRSESSAIVCQGSLSFDGGVHAEISGGDKSPAVTLKGDMICSGATVSIFSFISESASSNCALSVTGNVTVSGGSRLSVDAYEQFGMIINSGKLTVNELSQMFVSGGSGIYGYKSSVSVSGGSLYTSGSADSGLRLSSGSVSVTENGYIFSQGKRFGVELLGSGSLTLNGCRDFVIRSTDFVALYIEDGELSIDGIDRISGHLVAGNGDNRSVWCSSYNEKKPAWENPCDQFASYTALEPSCKQIFKNGLGEKCEQLDSETADWEVNRYCCLSVSNTRPVAQRNQFSIPAGKTYSWQLYGYSYLGTGVTYSLENTNCEGEIRLSSDGKLTYTARSTTRGKQTFTYTVTDAEGIESVPAAVDIIVSASKLPVAYNMSFETGISEKLMGNVTVRDYDGVIAEVVVVTPPEHGDFIMANDGAFVYEPHGLFNGIDSFSYYAVDAAGDQSTVATATIFIGYGKVHRAYNMTIFTQRDEEVVAALDTVIVQPKKKTQPEKTEEENPEESEKTEEPEEPPTVMTEVVITEEPVYGKLTVDDQLRVVYTPFDNFAGTDSFSYYMMTSDELVSNTAQCSVIIIPGHRPDADSAEVCMLKERKNTYTLTASDLDGIVKFFQIEEMPEHGTLELNPSTGAVEYIPEKGFTGKDSFTFSVIDNEDLMSKTATVSITVADTYEYLKATGLLLKIIIAASSVILLTGLAVFLFFFLSRRAKRMLEEDERENYDLYHDEFGEF